MLKHVFLISILCLGFSAQAQLDSSSVLLRPSGNTLNPEDLDSTRYRIRTPESKREDPDFEEKPGSLIPSPVPTRAKRQVEPKKTSAPVPSSTAVVTPAVVKPTPTTSQSTGPVPAPVPGPGLVPMPEEATPVAEQVRELILGGSTQDIEEVRRQIHPEDPRANVLSISVAPAYFYESSQSEYSFRRFTTNAPGLGLGMNLWLTPFFGLQSKYFTSVTASVRNGLSDQVPLEVQSFEAGIRFRKHFGYSRRAAQMSWGIDYHDAHDKVSRDSTSNVGRKSSGLSLVFEGKVPNSLTYAHTFTVDIRPRLHHSETSSGVEVHSGTKVESNALSLAVGGEWTLDRRNQMFWKTQFSVERNLFQGAADTEDPHTGLTPNGVSVTNNLMIFYFGFKWGS